MTGLMIGVFLEVLGRLSYFQGYRFRYLYYVFFRLWQNVYCVLRRGSFGFYKDAKVVSIGVLYYGEVFVSLVRVQGSVVFDYRKRKYVFKLGQERNRVFQMGGEVEMIKVIGSYELGFEGIELQGQAFRDRDGYEGEAGDFGCILYKGEQEYRDVGLTVDYIKLKVYFGSEMCRQSVGIFLFLGIFRGLFLFVRRQLEQEARFGMKVSLFWFSVVNQEGFVFVQFWEFEECVERVRFGFEGCSWYVFQFGF